MSDRLDAALALARLGIMVLPLHEAGVNGAGQKWCSCNRADCSSQGKHPRTQHGVDDQSRDETVIRSWWRRWPRANVAIATGRGSNVDVLDVDGEAGKLTLAELENEHGPLPLTVKALTGKGYHFFFRHDDRAWNRVGLDANVDVRAHGGYVVAPPSVHVTGRVYSWAVSPDDWDVAAWPEWLITKLLALREAKTIRPAVALGPLVSIPGQTRYGATVILSCMNAMEAARVPVGDRAGNRNDTLNRQAYILGQLEAAGEPIGDAFERLCLLALNKGLDQDEIMKTAASGYGDGLKNPKAIRARGAR
jgi:hypothetical protein